MESIGRSVHWDSISLGMRQKEPVFRTPLYRAMVALRLLTDIIRQALST